MHMPNVLNKTAFTFIIAELSRALAVIKVTLQVNSQFLGVSSQPPKKLLGR